jgi:predicted nucleic acid-binding protein
VADVIVLDASVLIAYLDAEDAQHRTAESLLAREVDDEFAVNPLTLAEVLVGPSRIGRLDAARSALRELEVTEQPFPADTAVRLARLRTDTGLRMPDCCVLLAAQDATARVAAFDDRLVRAAEELGLVALRS